MAHLLILAPYYIYQKVKKQINVKNDHENKQFALEELNKLEGYSVHFVFYDSMKNSHDYEKIHKIRLLF